MKKKAGKRKVMMSALVLLTGLAIAPTPVAIYILSKIFKTKKGILQLEYPLR